MLGNKKLFVGLAALFSVLVLGMASCGGDDDSGADADSGEPKKVVFSVYSDEPVLVPAVIKGLEERAAEKGWDFTALVGDYDPAAQVAQIENALAQQPDGLIIWSPDPEAPVPVARQAAEQGARVLTMGADLGQVDAREAYVGPDYVEIGAEKAEALVELMGGEGKLGVIHGIQGADFTEKMSAGGDPVFEAADGIELVDTQYAGAYTTEAGLETAENMITANPDITGIWTDNDDQAFGVNQVLEAHDLLDQVIVASTGGYGGLEEVRAGRIAFTHALCGVEDGFIAIDALESLFNGETLPDRVATNVVVVTPDNVEEEIPNLEDCD